MQQEFVVPSEMESSDLKTRLPEIPGQWGELMGDNAIATATLDCLLHHAEVVIIKGESYRVKKLTKFGLVPLYQLSSVEQNGK